MCVKMEIVTKQIRTTKCCSFNLTTLKLSYIINLEGDITNYYEDYDDELEEYEKDIEEKGQDKKEKPKTKKKTKRKKVRKTKTKTKKGKNKVVYKNKRSPLFTFILILIILGLLAVIGYLVYENYYNKEEKASTTESKNEDAEAICEAKTTTFSISLGLKKCSDQQKFKLIVTNTNLSFDITRINDNKYIINAVYYKDDLINASKIIGIQIDDNWKLKTKDGIIYLLVQNEENQILIAIDNGNIIYQSSGLEYNLSSDITYIKYTDLGLEEINTCDYYETNNLLESEMWTKGELVYENGSVTETDDEVVLAQDVCKK